MTGSGDEADFRDTMANRGMTELEAVLYEGIQVHGLVPSDSIMSDDESMARFLATYLIQHLPETSDDNPSERASPEPTVE
jgi:hypothetical protein